MEFFSYRRESAFIGGQNSETAGLLAKYYQPYRAA
jgi:hypothetical protein